MARTSSGSCVRVTTSCEDRRSSMTPIHKTSELSFIRPSARPIQLGSPTRRAMGKTIAVRSSHQLMPSERACSHDLRTICGAVNGEHEAGHRESADVQPDHRRESVGEDDLYEQGYRAKKVEKRAAGGARPTGRGRAQHAKDCTKDRASQYRPKREHQRPPRAAEHEEDVVPRDGGVE